MPRRRGPARLVTATQHHRPVALNAESAGLRHTRISRHSLAQAHLSRLNYLARRIWTARAGAGRAYCSASARDVRIRVDVMPALVGPSWPAPSHVPSWPRGSLAASSRGPGLPCRLGARPRLSGRRLSERRERKLSRGRRRPTQWARARREWRAPSLSSHSVVTEWVSESLSSHWVSDKYGLARSHCMCWWHWSATHVLSESLARTGPGRDPAGGRRTWTGQAPEFKFESKFQLLLLIWQFLLKAVSEGNRSLKGLTAKSMAELLWQHSGTSMVSQTGQHKYRAFPLLLQLLQAGTSSLNEEVQPLLLCWPQASLRVWMIEFFFPNSRALLPIFHTNCPDGSLFAQMGSHFVQNTASPVLYSIVEPSPLLTFNSGVGGSWLLDVRSWGFQPA